MKVKQQILMVALLLLTSESQTSALGISMENQVNSNHRLSQKSATHLHQRQRQRLRQQHRASQTQKHKSKQRSQDEEQNARETLSSVEIAEVQTDEQKGPINAEDAESEQKRQDKAKFDEVMTLMNKYDQAEAHIKWVNSPEYAQQKEQEKYDAQKRQQEAQEKEKQQEEEEKDRAEEEQKQKKLSLVQQEEETRHNQEYVKNSVTKYLTAFSEMDGRRVLTKDKAYVAAGDILSKVRKLKGVKQTRFLDEHFKSVWDAHDTNKNNLIEQSDVEEFYNDILSAGQAASDSNQDDD